MLRHRTTAFVCVCLAVVGCLQPRREAARRPRPGAGARRRPGPRAGRRLSRRLFPAKSRPGDAVRRARPPPRRARRTTRLDALEAWQAKEDGWLEQAAADRSGRHRGASLRGHLRHRPRGAGGVDRRARVCRTSCGRSASSSTAGRCRTATPVTIQPVGHRRGAQGRAGALEPAAALRRHRDRQPARRAEGRLFRAEGQRPDRHRPDGHADRDADRGIAVRLAVGARQDARVRAAVRPAGARADRAGVQALPRFPADGVPAGGARGDRRVGQLERRRPATTRRSGITARCRRRRARCTRPACARSSSSTRR